MAEEEGSKRENRFAPTLSKSAEPSWALVLSGASKLSDSLMPSASSADKPDGRFVLDFFASLFLLYKLTNC